MTQNHAPQCDLQGLLVNSIATVHSDHDFWYKMSEQWNWKMGSAERVSRATVKLRDRINSLFRKKGVPWLKPVALNP